MFSYIFVFCFGIFFGYVRYFFISENRKKYSIVDKIHTLIDVSNKKILCKNYIMKGLYNIYVTCDNICIDVILEYDLLNNETVIIGLPYSAKSISFKEIKIKIEKYKSLSLVSEKIFYDDEIINLEEMISVKKEKKLMEVYD